MTGAGVNATALALGLGSWKPLFTALVLPPVPWLGLVIASAALMRRHRGWGWTLALTACAGLWLCSTDGMAELVVRRLVQPPVALELARESAVLQDPAVRRASAVVVLGGGRERLAPEYGAASLSPPTLDRLRYGIWLGRRLDLPLAFSGGVGHRGGQEAPEAEVAGRVAAEEFGSPLRWQETASRDTRENADLTVPLLARDGVRRIVLVTHGWHMPRALRAFREAAARSGADIEVVPAPMALAQRQEDPLLRWLPSAEGSMLVRQALREWLGRMAGA